MDLLKMGLRNVLGIMAPGAMMLIAFALAAFLGLFPYWHFKSQQPVLSYFHYCAQFLQVIPKSLSFIGFILISYVIGSVFRLTSADEVDEESEICLLRNLIADLIKRKENSKKSKQSPIRKTIQWVIYEKFPSASRRVNKLLKAIEQKKQEWEINQAKTDGNTEGILDLKKTVKDYLETAIEIKLTNKDEYSLLWTLDRFPYTKWEFAKFAKYHPKGVKQFFSRYKEIMQFDGVSGKEFYNFFKMTIKHVRKSLTDPVVEEIDYMEATVRFYAGTFKMLQYACTALIVSFITQFILIVYPIVYLFLYRQEMVLARMTIPIFIVLTVTGFMFIFFNRFKIEIQKQFRFIRLKEVDTIYDALYLAMEGTTEL
jgi:hypothetical protein